jgi:hypothetical protein
VFEGGNVYSYNSGHCLFLMINPDAVYDAGWSCI